MPVNEQKHVTVLADDTDACTCPTLPLSAAMFKDTCGSRTELLLISMPATSAHCGSMLGYRKRENVESTEKKVSLRI